MTVTVKEYLEMSETTQKKLVSEMTDDELNRLRDAFEVYEEHLRSQNRIKAMWPWRRATLNEMINARRETQK